MTTLVIVLSERRNPQHVLGYYDASASAFSTDRNRAIKFGDLSAAMMALEHLRFSRPTQSSALYIRSMS